MLQRLGIRGKILAVVAVPILVLMLAAGFITFGATQDLSSARNSEQLVDTLDAARSLEESLQEERDASVNYVHIVQDSSSKLVVGRNDTDEALVNLVAAIEESGAENADALIDGVYDALGVSGPDDELFTSERSLAVTASAEEGGWAQFPGADEVTAMQETYAAAQEAVAAVAEQAPADLGGAFNNLDFRIGYESDTATTLFTAPLPYRDALEGIFDEVDGGIQAMLGSTERLADNEANTAAVAALASGEQAVANLAPTRDAIRAAQGNVRTYLGFYRNLLTTIVGAADDVAVAMTDRDVVAAMQAYGDIDELIENIKFEKVQFERLIRAGTYDVGEATQAQTLTVTTNLSLANAQTSSASIPGAAPVPDFGASVGFGSALDQQSFESIRAAILRGTDTDLVAQRQNQWPEQVAEELEVYEPLADDMWSDVETMVAEDSQAALTQAILTGLVAILVVVASVVIALLIARRIVNPLRRLTTTATAVRQELPRLVERVAMPGETVDVSEVQIDVESRDEIGTLADAFNGVNAATLAIAGEQAALRGSISEMFVNVARRDQVLLNRQLGSIDEMERTEDDPETLTKLFALDHLATRMRRNSESLLVLAGIDTGRRLRRPMPLSDVIRTASSEIELYERVQLELDADPSMLGHSALTAAHLFAELLENATVFSDPGSPVVVRTAMVDGNYVVEVEDSGIGMTEAELADANGRVDSTAASEILGAQRLGLFVVGRIARRVGARVHIASEEGHGTVATVTMPPSLFAADADAPAEHVTSTATDEATHAPAALVSHDASEEEIDTAARPAAAAAAVAGAAYSPTVIEEGSSLLAGRGGQNADVPEQDAAPAEDPNSIDALIARDAAEAPEAEETQPTELTEGTSAAGLPTRRRRQASPAAPADPEREQQSIVGLPAEATDAQLSALEAEQAGGFTPSLSPSEVSPQSAEERASMFRGFRSRRATEQPDGDVAPEAAASAPALEPDEDAPSASSTPDTDLGGAAAAGAAAFGAAAFFGSRGADQASAPSAPEPPAEPADDSPSAVAEPAPAEPTPAVAEDAGTDEDEIPTFRMPKFAAGAAAGASATEATERHEGASAPSAPDAGAQAEPDDPAALSTPIADEEPEAPMVIPTLEGDDEPIAADDPASASAQEGPEQPHVEDYHGVETVSLEDDEPGAPAWLQSPPAAASAQESSAWAASAPEIEEPSAATPWAPEPEAAPAEPVAQDDPAVGFATSAPSAPQPSYEPEPASGQALAPEPTPEPQPTPDAAATPAQRAPSMDELIQSAVDDEQEQRPGFFSRLFGRGGSKGAAAAGAAGAAAGAAAASQHQPSAPSQASAATAFRPTTDVDQTPAPSAASAPPLGGFAPEPTPEPIAPQPEPEPTGADAYGYAPQQPSAPQFEPQEQAPPEPAAPAEPSPAGGWSPTDAPAQAPTEPEPAAASAPPPAPPTAGGAWAPQEGAAQPEDDWSGVYSPDQLAKPAGWEAAGQSALQAAEPEVATSYQPVIQPDESHGGDSADMTSAVFSELSSLASERPKVEKTRAGLQRRRPSDAKPVEVKPIEDEVEVKPAERDADAVRERFSSFYSGTQRARDDQAAFEQQTEPAEANE